MPPDDGRTDAKASPTNGNDALGTSELSRAPARGAVVAWLAVRLPLLLLLAVVLRVQLIAVIEPILGIRHITEQVIFQFSTITSRLLLLVLGAVTLFVVLKLMARASAQKAGLLALGASALFFGALLGWSWQSPLAVFAGLLLGALFALNGAPQSWLPFVEQRPGLSRALRGFLLVVPGTELLLPRIWCGWILERVFRVRSARVVAIVSNLAVVAVCCAVFAAVLSWKTLARLDRSIYQAFGTQIIELGRADMNWLELDTNDQRLFVSGHGLDHLLSYDLRDDARPPLASAESIGLAQSFSYDSHGKRLFVFNPTTKELLCLSAKDLSLVDKMPLAGIAYGDAWILYDHRTGHVTVASEADVNDGTPTVVVDWATKKIVDSLPEPLGNLLLHPKKPYLYRSYFRGGESLEILDTTRNKVIRRVKLDPRSDRLAYWEAGEEILVASPVKSRVARYDAETLAPKGFIPTTFGVRGLAVDQRRNLLLAGSLATSKLDVIDLTNGRRLDRFHVGPWLRTILVDEGRALAYVSSVEGLVKLTYVR